VFLDALFIAVGLSQTKVLSAGFPHAGWSWSGA